MTELTPDSSRKKTVNLSNELAKERNRAAAERTLMAWIRTCLSLISFGFAIDTLLQALTQTHLKDNTNLAPSAYLVALSFIVLGIFAMLAATVEHRKVLRLIRRDDYVYAPPSSIAMVTAISLMLIGIFAFTVVLVGWFHS